MIGAARRVPRRRFDAGLGSPRLARARRADAPGRLDPRGAGARGVGRNRGDVPRAACSSLPASFRGERRCENAFPSHVFAAAATARGRRIPRHRPGRTDRESRSAGVASIFFRVSEPLATAIAVLPSGEILAASAPGGKIYKVRPDGSGSVWCQTDERYVWAHARRHRRDRAGRDRRSRPPAQDRPQRACVGVLRRGRVPSRQPLPCRDGGFWAGGAGRGLLYHVDAEGHGRVVYDDDLPEAKALLLMPLGRPRRRVRRAAGFRQATAGASPAGRRRWHFGRRLDERSRCAAAARDPGRDRGSAVGRGRRDAPPSRQDRQGLGGRRRRRAVALAHGGAVRLALDGAAALSSPPESPPSCGGSRAKTRSPCSRRLKEAQVTAFARSSGTSSRRPAIRRRRTSWNPGPADRDVPRPLRRRREHRAMGPAQLAHDRIRRPRRAVHPDGKL